MGAEPDRALTMEVTEDIHDAQHLQVRLQVAMIYLSTSLLPLPLLSSPSSLPSIPLYPIFFSSLPSSLLPNTK